MIKAIGTAARVSWSASWGVRCIWTCRCACVVTGARTKGCWTGWASCRSVGGDVGDVDALQRSANRRPIGGWPRGPARPRTRTAPCAPQAMTAQPGDLVVLDPCPLVHGARRQRCGALDSRRDRSDPRSAPSRGPSNRLGNVALTTVAPSSHPSCACSSACRSIVSPTAISVRLRDREITGLLADPPAARAPARPGRRSDPRARSRRTCAASAADPARVRSRERPARPGHTAAHAGASDPPG